MSRHFLNQSEAKPKPIMTCLHAFSPYPGLEIPPRMEWETRTTIPESLPMVGMDSPWTCAGSNNFIFNPWKIPCSSNFESLSPNREPLTYPTRISSWEIRTPEPWPPSDETNNGASSTTNASSPINSVSRPSLAASAGFDRKTIFRGVGASRSTHAPASAYRKGTFFIFFLQIMTRRVMLQSVAGPSPILQDAPLPSQKTWMDMMSRLKNKYRKRKKKTRKSRSSKKKKTWRRRPTRAQKTDAALHDNQTSTRKKDSNRRHVASWISAILSWRQPEIESLPPIDTVSSVEQKEQKRNPFSRDLWPSGN